jgi:hypothetical protein
MIMSDIEALDTRDVDGTEYRVYLEHDTDCESPREFGDYHAGRIVCVRSREYVRPEEDGDDVSASLIQYAIEDHDFQVVARWLRVFHGASTVLPLYSGYGDRPSAGDVTDSPKRGDYIGVTFDQPSTRRITGVELSDMPTALSVDVDEFSAWARGEAHGYVIERRAAEPHPDCHAVHDAEQWEQTDSLWGLIGDDYARAQALQALSDVRGSDDV